MAKLNQLIAALKGKKSRLDNQKSTAYQQMQKPELLNGLTRRYTPKDEDGEILPIEDKPIITTCQALIDALRASMQELIDCTGTVDLANTMAKADIVVDGKTIIANVPVTHLLFLEKQLVDLHTFVSKLPVLDPAEHWEYDAVSSTYRSKPSHSIRNKKVSKPVVMYPATPEHPAQVQLVTEDVFVGTWELCKFSSAIPQQEKNSLIKRVNQLQEAVKYAREAANTIDVTPFSSGTALLAFVFDN